MKAAQWRRWAASIAAGLRRFPVGLGASVVAAAAAILWHHASEWGLSDGCQAVLQRVLLLWPWALFSNVAWRLRCERAGRAPGWGLAVLGLLLVGGWFVLPARPEQALPAFWFGYWFAILALMGATLTLPARRTGPPDLWDTGWPVLLAAFMATLAAMIAAGGVNLALVSIEKLFELAVDDDLYFDVMLVGFFLLGPITAFVWLPRPFAQAAAQPAWLRGAARVLLAPLCGLYALILFAYIGKIALAAQWPDGWVAMPTLIFAAIGLLAYLIARPARERLQERWAGWFCRIFPAVLIPLAVVLLLAMRIRIGAYGFTEWRTAGLYLGGWILGVALLYTVRPRLSPWWITATLTLLLALSAAGPLALPGVARQSQRARLERLLADLEVWQRDMGERLEVTGEDGKNLRSILDYLLRQHGGEALPARVLTRWNDWRASQDEPPVTAPGRGGRRIRGESSQVLTALGIVITDEEAQQWLTFRCDDQPLALEGWSRLTPLTVRRSAGDTGLPIRVDHELNLWAGTQEVARAERAAFFARLDERAGLGENHEVRLPPEDLTLRFTHAGRSYGLLFLQINRGSARNSQPTEYRTYGDNCLLFEQ